MPLQETLIEPLDEPYLKSPVNRKADPHISNPRAELSALLATYARTNLGGLRNARIRETFSGFRDEPKDPPIPLRV